MGFETDYNDHNLSNIYCGCKLWLTNEILDGTMIITFVILFIVRNSSLQIYRS